MIQHKLNDFYESDSKTEAAHPTAVLSAAQLKLTPPGWLWATGTNISPGFLRWASSKTQASEKMPSSRNKYTAPCLKSSGARSIGRVLNASLPRSGLRDKLLTPSKPQFSHLWRGWCEDDMKPRTPSTQHNARHRAGSHQVPSCPLYTTRNEHLLCTRWHTKASSIQKEQRQHSPVLRPSLG